MSDLAAELDLRSEGEALLRAARVHETGHSARTLVKQAELRVVLVALRAGAHIHEHRTDHAITIHTLSGRIGLHLPDRQVDLPAQRVLYLDRNVPHDVIAEEDSVFLLSIAWNTDKESRP